MSCFEDKTESLNKIQLRHLATGKILQFIKIDGKELAVLSDKEGHSSLYFKSLENLSHLLHENMYYLVNRETDYIMQADEKIEIDFDSHFQKMVEQER